MTTAANRRLRTQPSNAVRCCRACGHELITSFCDLGATPLANSFLSPEKLSEPEPYYPLHAWVCDNCLLVQLEQFNTPAEIFSDYVYFSSFSETWLAHAEAYCDTVSRKLSLNRDSFVVEIASNDGYLLRNFVAKGIPCLGIEPAANVAKVACERNVDTLVRFFGDELAKELAEQDRRADLIIANNVLAHVPDLNDFIRGLKVLLKEGGTITIEVPHLLNLMRHGQFDTIYHEHFSYFSLTSARKAFDRHSLRIFDVEELPTHGGSIRLYACAKEDKRADTAAIGRTLQEERVFGLTEVSTYQGFGQRALQTKLGLVRFVIDAVGSGAKIACYGAAAKGNTLLNYCGLRNDLIAFAVDRNPHKQGLRLPGSRIPVFAPDYVGIEKPDYLLILPWNLKDEIVEQMSHIRQWNGRFVVAVPQIEILA